MKNMYANINAAIKAGAVKTFVIGYEETCNGRPGFTFTEADTLSEAKRIKAQMKAEGHNPSIEIYTR